MIIAASLCCLQQFRSKVLWSHQPFVSIAAQCSQLLIKSAALHCEILSYGRTTPICQDEILLCMFRNVLDVDLIIRYHSSSLSHTFYQRYHDIYELLTLVDK